MTSASPCSGVVSDASQTRSKVNNGDRATALDHLPMADTEAIGKSCLYRSGSGDPRPEKTGRNGPVDSLLAPTLPGLADNEQKYHEQNYVLYGVR
jgi:hypothetical protein